MLFHVTMTHTAEDCPGYDREKLVKLVEAGENWDDLAAELGIQVHFFLWGAPEHLAWALIEADDIASVSRFCIGLPFRQDFDVTPVQHVQDLIAMGRKMLAQS